MPVAIQRLTDLAQSILDASVAILDTTTALAPASQFLTPARPAFDCEFVAVEIARLQEDNTAALGLSVKRRGEFGNIILATFVIYVVRCAPQITGAMPPTDAAKTASAATVHEDGWALWNGLRSQSDILFDSCLGVYFDGGLPILEQGGYVGWQFQIRASIEGYDA